MLKILQHLSQSDLRVFAQASRACYAHALEAGLCIRRDIFWTNEDGFGNSLEKLDSVLDRAENRPGLNIAIAVMAVPWGDDAAAAYRDDMAQLTVSIRRALPNLVRLQVPLADYAALCTNEAPKLEGLTIYHPGLDVPTLFPSNLLNGSAPRLRKVELSLTDTDWTQPSAAFSNVSHLKLAAGCITQPLRFARLFPALRVLAIDARSGSTPSAQSIDLRGLPALRHFALSGDTALLDDGSLTLLRDIPVFEHEPAHPDGADPVCPAHNGEVCGVVERRGIAGPPAISFVPRDPSTRQWRRTILLRSLPGGALPLADMPLLASNLVSLTVDASLVNALAQAPLVLDKLRELVVDLCHSPRVLDDPFMGLILNSVARVRCPALESIVLLFLPDGEGAGAIRIELDMVARWQHALRLRTGRPKLQLILAGGAWRHPDSASGSTHLPQSTSMDDSADLSVVDVPEYCERCHCTDLFEGSRWDEA